MLRKKIYKWHRTLSLIIAVPVFLWAVSGFMHPLMTNVKPKVAASFIIPKPIDSHQIKIGIGDVLKKHDIGSYHRFRLISIDTNWFYQIQTHAQAKPIYYSSKNGRVLANGDVLYAQYLAAKFLTGTKEKSKEDVKESLNESVQEESDCCTSATDCINDIIRQSHVKNISYVQSFNKEYREINRLLPVYKIDYERKDGIRLYVETTSDRLAYAVDDKRASFDQIFFLLHNWGWMEFAGDLKYVLMSLVLALTIFTTLMGLYILRITKSVKKNDTPSLKARYRHRKFSVLAFVFTLMFAFSGAFHALDKLNKQNKNGLLIQQNIEANTSPDLKSIQEAIPHSVINFSSVIIRNNLYWQVLAKDFHKQGSSPVLIYYFDTKNHQLLKNGDEQYAVWLATQHSSLSEKNITTKEQIKKFEGEYGFVNKRLPVWKIGFNQDDNARYYIETSTGYLSTVVKDGDLWEGLSFAYLHKHHFMGWLGKIGRDISTMFWALVQIILIATGLILWVRRKNKV